MELPDRLGDEEGKAVIVAVINAQPATERQILRAVNWANGAYADAVLLSLVLKGALNILVPEDPRQGLRWVAPGARPGRQSGRRR